MAPAVHSDGSELDVRSLVLDVQEKQMTEDLTAEEVRALLNLNLTQRAGSCAAEDLRAFQQGGGD
jgi:hypothetical protein